MEKMHDQTNLSNNNRPSIEIINRDNRPKKIKVVNNMEPSCHILEYGLKFSLFNIIG